MRTIMIVSDRNVGRFDAPRRRGQVGGAVDADDQVVLGLADLGGLVEDAAQLDAGQALVLAEQV